MNAKAGNPLHPDLRISALAVRFRQIGDDHMRDLPFYNAALEVEAFDFFPLGDDDLAGVLITPWFMNLVVLPRQPVAMEPQRCGEIRRIALPGGERSFLYGGDPVVGALWAHSLHSPMQKFATQDQARSEARLRLAQVMSRPQPLPAAPANTGRRAFLTGMARV